MDAKAAALRMFHRVYGRNPRDDQEFHIFVKSTIEHARRESEQRTNDPVWKMIETRLNQREVANDPVLGVLGDLPEVLFNEHVEPLIRERMSRPVEIGQPAAASASDALIGLQQKMALFTDPENKASAVINGPLDELITTLVRYADHPVVKAEIGWRNDTTSQIAVVSKVRGQIAEVTLQKVTGSGIKKTRMYVKPVGDKFPLLIRPPGANGVGTFNVSDRVVMDALTRFLAEALYQYQMDFEAETQPDAAPSSDRQSTKLSFPQRRRLRLHWGYLLAAVALAITLFVGSLIMFPEWTRMNGLVFVLLVIVIDRTLEAVANWRTAFDAPHDNGSDKAG